MVFAEPFCVCDKPEARFNKKHSALYCINCDVWIEPTCNKFDCSYCAGRPKRPSEVKDE